MLINLFMIYALTHVHPKECWTGDCSEPLRTRWSAGGFGENRWWDCMHDKSCSGDFSTVRTVGFWYFRILNKVMYKFIELFYWTGFDYNNNRQQTGVGEMKSVTLVYQICKHESYSNLCWRPLLLSQKQWLYHCRTISMESHKATSDFMQTFSCLHWCSTPKAVLTSLTLVCWG